MEFGEPTQFKNSTVAYKMNVTSFNTFIDVKSLRSFLKAEELSNVNYTGFVKLVALTNDP